MSVLSVTRQGTSRLRGPGVRRLEILTVMFFYLRGGGQSSPAKVRMIDTIRSFAESTLPLGPMALQCRPEANANAGLSFFSG